MSIPLPEVQEAMLDEAALEALLTDLELAAQVDEVLIKGAACAHAAAGSVPLSEVRRYLSEGCAVQIRYRHEGKPWCDTLMPGPTGARLVRIPVL